MTKYPLPSYAVSVWANGDHLMVAFPPTVGEQGHTIKLPLSGAGLKTAVSILRDRAEATDLRLSQRGTPSQYEVENDQRYKALMRARQADKAATQAEIDEAAAFLEELGL